MNNDETCELFKRLMQTYPNDKFFARNQEQITGSIEVWQEALEDVPLECAMRFLKDHIRKSPYMPAVCDFYQFHKQELIDKRMRIESAQEEFIGDNRNVLLETARQMYEQGLITNPFKKKAQEKVEEEKKE